LYKFRDIYTSKEISLKELLGKREEIKKRLRRLETQKRIETYFQEAELHYFSLSYSINIIRIHAPVEPSGIS
jgi:phosphopantetheinyl transferase